MMVNSYMGLAIRVQAFLLVLIVQVFWGAASLHAVLPKPASILYQVLETNQNVFQFYAELKVSVYDPEEFAPLNEEADTSFKPYENTEDSFKQHIVFVRDEFISIETMDAAGKLLHLFINEIGGRTFSTVMAPQRPFSDTDVFLPSLIFFTKFVSIFEDYLYIYEIVPNQLAYGFQQDQVFYQIGSETNHIKVDPDRFKVLEIQNQIQVQGRYYPVKIEFSEWNAQKKAIPEVIRYYVKSRLFKESRIVHIQYSGIYSKRNTVVRKYKDLLPVEAPFEIDINYGQ